MEVILLERVAKLGQIGDIVRVKDGFARNYLLRKGKALRATKENRSRFEKMRVELEARNLEQKEEAEKIAQKLDGQSYTVLRQAAEGGQLYGSVSPRDIAVLVTEAGFVVSRAQVALQAPRRWRLGTIPQTRQQQVAGPASLPQLPAGRPPRRLPAQDRPGDCPLPRSRTVAEA